MSKVETYRLSFRDNLRQLTVDLNAIFARLEDRLDTVEGVRLGGYFTTQRWEKEFLKEDS